MDTSTIDNFKNQYPHLSDQQIADVIAGRDATDYIQNYYPHLDKEAVKAFVKGKPGAKKTAVILSPEAAEKKRQAIEKGKATKAAKAAAKAAAKKESGN